MKSAKKRSPAVRSASRRTGPPKTVDEYLARIPEPGRTTLQKVRAAIRAAAPRTAVETISYGIPALRYNRIIIWYAAFRDHCSLFPTSAVIAQFKDELGSYVKAKGTIQFPVDQPLPAALIKKMVKARVVEIESKRR